jgi:hypothetical protein
VTSESLNLRCLTQALPSSGLVAFLARPASNFTTGSTLAVDGGHSV